MKRIIVLLVACVLCAGAFAMSAAQVKELAEKIEEAKKEGAPKIIFSCGSMKGIGTLTVVEDGEAETQILVCGDGKKSV